MLLSVGADAHGTQLQKEVLVLQCLPHVAGTGKAHPLAVAADALLVEHIHIHFVEDEHVLGFHGGVPHHGLIFFLGAAVVALTVAAVGAKRVAVHIDRLIGTLCTGDVDDHDVVAVHLLNEHIFGRQHIHAGLVRVVDDVPKLLDEFLRVGQIHRAEGLVCQFLHAQQDDAAVGIGKGGVGLPDTLGQAAEGLLGLDSVILPVLLYLGKVNHAAPPSPTR